jgi:pimeloyl-ACP methyl ester carboxylesterase
VHPLLLQCCADVRGQAARENRDCFQAMRHGRRRNIDLAGEETDTAMVTTHVRSTHTSTHDRETSAIHHFMELQAQMLDFYGVNARSRFVELAVPRMRLHVLEAGEGQPVVIFHGGDGEAVNWAPLMGHLQQHAHVFAVDRPGFGLSDPFDYRHVNMRQHAADVVASLLDALGLDSAVLVGGSMGGFFVTAATLAHPTRVRGLVFFGFAAGITSSLPVPLRIICGVPGMSRLFMRNKGTLEAQKSQYRNLFHIDPETIPDLYFETRIAGIALPSAQGTWSTLLRRFGGLRGVRPDMYLGDDVPRIQSPTLVLWGENDMAPAEAGRTAFARIPGARFELLPGIGHFPFLEAPKYSAELVADFIQARR